MVLSEMWDARGPSPDAGGEMILSELMSVEFHSCCERARSGLGVPSPPHTSGGYLWNRGPIAVQYRVPTAVTSPQVSSRGDCFSEQGARVEMLASSAAQLSSVSVSSSISGARPYTTGVVSRPPLAGDSSFASATIGLRRPSTQPLLQVPTLQAQQAFAAKAATPSRPPAGPSGAKKSLDEQSVDRIYDLMMSEEASFVGDVNKMLLQRERAQARKVRLIHNEWEAEVFERVQDEVSNKVNARSMSDVRKRNKGLMQDFIYTSNSKYPHGVFRDIIIPAEYDPLHGAEMKKITFQTHLARDPCKLDLRKLVDQPPEAKTTTVHARRVAQLLICVAVDGRTLRSSAPLSASLITSVIRWITSVIASLIKWTTSLIASLIRWTTS